VKRALELLKSAKRPLIVLARRRLRPGRRGHRSLVENRIPYLTTVALSRSGCGIYIFKHEYVFLFQKNGISHAEPPVMRAGPCPANASATLQGPCLQLSFCSHRGFNRQRRINRFIEQIRKSVEFIEGKLLRDFPFTIAAFTIWPTTPCA